MNTTYSTAFIGRSAWNAETQERIAHVAPFRANVLIAGPSGTGKELIARALHAWGPRAAGPFVPVNCAAVPRELFDSQMFGHTKGAFTGAAHESVGCIRAAEGGTLLLDEIGELDLDLQAKLLRVLQDRQVTPVGSHQPLPIDVRVVAATNRDLAREVAEGRFRLDLYYRLNVIEVPTLALRERVEDIEPLARHMLAKACAENGLPDRTLSAAAIGLLERHDWPGNVRELQNLMERVALAPGPTIVTPAAIQSLWSAAEVALLAHDVSPCPADAPSPVEADATDWKTLQQLEAEHIELTLQQTANNQSAAARLLGIDRKRLARKAALYGLLATVGA